MCRVQHRTRVVAGEEVLRGKRRDGCIGVLAEEGVVSHAYAHEDVQVRLRFVEEKRLHDGIADDTSLAAPCRGLEVEVGPPVAFELAANRLDTKSRLFEQLGQDARLAQHDGARRDADVGGADEVRELDGVLHARGVCRLLADHRGGLHDDVVFGKRVQTLRLVMQRGRDRALRAKPWLFAIGVFACSGSAAHAIEL